MTIVDTFRDGLGQWAGIMRLRMLPTDEYIGSPATASVAVRGGAYIAIEYTWVHDDAAQDGLILLGEAMRTEGLSAVWVDSWHAAPKWMTFTGVAVGPTNAVAEPGELLLEGSYPADEGPDWGWRIRVMPPTDGELRIAMDNVVPGYDPYQAVEMVLRRA